jgi:hypothetical protein
MDFFFSGTGRSSRAACGASQLLSASGALGPNVVGNAWAEADAQATAEVAGASEELAAR